MRIRDRIAAACVAAALMCFMSLGWTPARAAETGRNLLLITIDTLRADHLSCNGAANVATPNLDRLTRGGVNFSRARAPVPLTLPSHASILTGNTPPLHSVRDNGAFRLPEDQLTLAEVTREHGYDTAAFVGSFVLDRRFGLNQGFQIYNDRVWSSVEELENLEAERTADEVFSVFATWLGSRDPSRPFFVWLHLYDPHAPYTPPEPFRSRYEGDPYAGEVAYVDSIIGKIMVALESQGLDRRSIVGVVGDHGEGLGEHREATHSLLIYNSTLHVPMLIWAPGLVRPGLDIERLSPIIDLAPTLLDLLGIGSSLGEGRSLRPWFGESEVEAGGTALDEPIVYSESLYAELNLGWSPLRGLEAGSYRLIHGVESELFDLRTDPGEQHNIAAQQPQVLRRLQRRLDEPAGDRTSRESTGAAAALDAEAVARLESLGYLSGSRPPAAGGGVPVDPKTKMELWNRIQEALYHYGQGAYGEAVELLQGALAVDPDLPLIYEYLGASYERLGDERSAQGVYRQAVQSGLDSASLHLALGKLALRQRRLQIAARELQAAIDLDPLSVPARHYLADVHRTGGRTQRAVELYRQALAINPDYVYSWNGLGRALAISGRGEEALTAFSRVVAIDPRGARGYFNLAVQLERLGRPQEAIEAYEGFLQRSQDGDFADEERTAEAAIKRLRSSS